MTPFGKMSPFGFMRGWENPFLGPFWRAGKKRAVAPTLQHIQVTPDGTTFDFIFNRNVTVTDATGLTVDASGGAATLTYASGTGERRLRFTSSRAVTPDEVITVDGDGATTIAAASGGVGLAAFADVPAKTYFELAQHYDDGVHTEDVLNPAWNPTVTSIANGTWTGDAATTWDTGVAPTAADRVVIKHHVTNDDTTAVAAGVLVYTGGKLDAVNNANTRLTVTTIAVIEDGILELGTEVAPVQAGFLCELVFRDTALPDAQLDPKQFSNGLLATGNSVIRLWGATKTTEKSDLLLTVEPLQGHTTLTFGVNIVGWEAGDKVILPPTDPIRDANTVGYDGFKDEEILEVQSVTDNVVTLTAPLARDHKGARDKNGDLVALPHAMNMTRNVVVRSETAGATVRGHVAVSNRADLQIGYCSFVNLARTTDADLDDSVVTNGITTHYGTNQRGRYPLHAHHLWGPVNIPNTGYQFRMIGVAIDDGLKWGLVLHEASFGHIYGCNVYNCQYSCYQSEQGNERANRFEECFGIRAVGSDPDVAQVSNIYTFMSPNECEFINCGGALAYNSVYLGHILHIDGLGRTNFNDEAAMVGGRQAKIRGGDLVNGIEDTDWEDYDQNTKQFAEHSGFVGYAADKIDSWDHYGYNTNPLQTISNFLAWAWYEEPDFIYGSGQPLLYSTWGGYKWVTEGPSPQSWTGSVKYLNFTAHNYDGPATARGIRIWRGAGEGPYHFETGDVHAPHPIVIVFPTEGGNPDISTLIAATKTVVLNDITTSNPAGQVTPHEIELELGILTLPGTWPLLSSVIPMLRQPIYVYNWQGVAGDDFQLYWDVQGPAEDAPFEDDYTQTGVTIYAATQAGLDNAASFALDGRCVGGILTPAGAGVESWLEGGKAEERLLASVADDGVTWTITGSGALNTDGTGWSGTGSTTGAVGLTYVSGDGTDTLVFTGDATIQLGETVTGAYDADTGDAADDWGSLLPDVSFAVTNDSTQAGGGGTGLTIGGADRLLIGTDALLIGS